MLNPNFGPTNLQEWWLRGERARAPRILLAEDDDDMREMLEIELQADGYTVVAAKDGTELLEALSEAGNLPSDAPDVIITDIQMPGYSGLHALAALRAAGWKTPVIVITASRSARLHEEATKLGADVIFDKPFDLDDLRTALLYLADAARSHDREGATEPEEPDPEVLR